MKRSCIGMKKVLALLLISSMSVSLFSQKDNGTVKMERFVEDLLSKMTLDDKIGQMNQLNLEGINDTLLTKIKAGQIGSMLNITDPKEINLVQETAVKDSRLGIPLIIGRDIIHGFKTIFPIPLGQAASFNPQIVEDGARVAATEARERGIHWTFAPMLDISRDARWGRIAESLGEDTYLAGKLGAAMVKGFQGNDLSSNNSLAACVKHFVGYGASEGGRDYNSTNIPERLMRNVYLPPFREAIEAGAVTLMTSFNDNDGIPSSGSSFLLKDILLKEWQFDGFVVSDWASMSEMLSHGYAVDRKDVAMLAANAGIDMEMVSETYVDYLKELVTEKKVSLADIDNYVRNILKVKYRLGLFDNPYVDTSKVSTAYSERHLQTARRAAVESAILLKNEDVLPLQRNGYADKVFIITSGENMAIHAAANIAMAVDNFKNRGYAELGGFILNRRDVPREEEKVEELAEDFRTSVIGTLSHSEQVPLSEELKKTLMECYPDSAMAGEYRTLAKQMYAICREDV